MTDSITVLPLALAQGVALTAWWMAIILAIPFIGWAWVVASVYDKDAAANYFPRERWNGLHILMGFLALAVVIAAPVPGFISIPVMAAILIADLAIYFTVRNRDDRISESQRWSLDFESLMAASKKEKGVKVDKGSAKMAFKGPDGMLEVPEKGTAEFDVRLLAEEIIQGAVDQRGGQLDVSPLKDGNYAFTTLVDGVRTVIQTAPAATAVPVLNVYKAAAGLDVTDRRRKLTGSFKLGPAGLPPETPVRCTTKGTSTGITVELLFDPTAQVQRRIDDLGLHEAQVADVRSLVEDGSGVVLVVAPADNGRTTTQYALVRMTDAYLNNVQTVEFDPQSDIEGVRTNTYDPTEEGADFATTVRSILRREPNVCLVSEMPDDETAKEVARADTERTRVYLSFKADSALTALQLYARSVGGQKDAAQSVRGVIAQKMVRRLCENCRTSFQPTPEMIKKLGLPTDTKELYRKSGQVLIRDKPHQCEVCGGSGFFGQVGVFEVYPMGDEERALFAANDMTGLRALFRRNRKMSLQTAALQHAREGQTSIEEVVRITQTQKAKAPKAQASAAQ